MDISSFNPDEFAHGLRNLHHHNEAIQGDGLSSTVADTAEQDTEAQVVMTADTLRAMLDEVATKAAAQATAATAEPARTSDIYAMTRLIAGMQAGASFAPVPTPLMHSGERHSSKIGGAAAILLAGAIGAGVVLAGQHYMSDTAKETNKEVQTTAEDSLPNRVYYSAVNNTIGSNTAADLVGTAAMIEKLQDGTYVADGTPVSWNVLTVSPDGTRYSIELAIPSPVGGFQPDNSLKERFKDSDISDEELARFLLANNIVIAKQAGLYIEIVGATTTNDGEHFVLKTLELTA